MPLIHVKEDETFENALRRFKRKCEKSGILSELKKRQHYEKPSAKRKRKAIAARKNSLLAQFPKYDSLVGVFLHPRGIDAYYDVADKFDRYHTLHRAGNDGLTVICSEELKVEGLEWAPIREIGGLVTVPGLRKP